MDDIALGVYGLRTVMVNLYAIDAQDGGWVLVDAGLPGSTSKIRAWAENQFGKNRPPKAIVLTHGHFDHVGALSRLCSEWHVPVYAHRMEWPYLSGRSKYPPPDPTVGGGAMAFMSSIYPRGPINVSRFLRELPEDGVVPGLPEWRWIPTPGHTAGHISLFRDSDRTLIAGDAFVTTRQESLFAVATQRPEIHGPPSYYTSDWEAAKLSVARLAGLFPSVIATGHGLPVYGPEAARALEALAEDFDELARPSKGRYVNSAAVVTQNGVVSLPPSKGNPLLTVAGIVALAGAGYWAAGVWKNKRRSKPLHMATSRAISSDEGGVIRSHTSSF